VVDSRADSTAAGAEAFADVPPDLHDGRDLRDRADRDARRRLADRIDRVIRIEKSAGGHEPPGRELGGVASQFPSGDPAGTRRRP